jgi:CRP-like cAMP-binding protein
MTPEGREFTLAVVESGTVFGEMALTAQQLEGAYAQAMESSEVSTMAREDLERLVLEKPQVGLRIMQVLSERLRRQETRLEDATPLALLRGRDRPRLIGVVSPGRRLPARRPHRRACTGNCWLPTCGPYARLPGLLRKLVDHHGMNPVRSASRIF